MGRMGEAFAELRAEHAARAPHAHHHPRRLQVLLPVTGRGAHCAISCEAVADGLHGASSREAAAVALGWVQPSRP